MSYTGDVEVGGPPDTRELPGLTITKLAVGPYDNNAYLLRCTATGEQVLIGNGRFYGGSFAIFSEAKLSDGLLDICVFPRATWGTVAACAWGIFTGRLHQAGGARHFQAESLTLNAPHRTPLELDGEIVGELPARFSVQRRRLRVIVP